MCESLYVWGTADIHNDACIIILSSSQDLAINYSFYYFYLVYCNNTCEWCVIAIVNQYFLRVLKRRNCCIFICLYGTVSRLTSTSTNKTGDTHMDTLLDCWNGRIYLRLQMKDYYENNKQIKMKNVLWREGKSYEKRLLTYRYIQHV